VRNALRQLLESTIACNEEYGLHGVVEGLFLPGDPATEHLDNRATQTPNITLAALLRLEHHFGRHPQHTPFQQFDRTLLLRGGERFLQTNRTTEIRQFYQVR